MPGVRFHYAPGACSLAPHILLHEIGIEFEGVPRSENLLVSPFQEDFRAINKKMRVPVLVLDGETITELPAISTLISSMAPEKGLMGKTPLEVARVYEWMNWLSGTLHGIGYGSLLRPMRFSEDSAAFDGIRAKGLETVKDCYEKIEAQLKGVHAVGDYFTAADAFLFVFFRWGTGEGLKMKQNYPKYAALVENLVQRPSVKATLAVEKIESTL